MAFTMFNSMPTAKLEKLRDRIHEELVEGAGKSISSATGGELTVAEEFAIPPAQLLTAIEQELAKRQLGAQSRTKIRYVC